MILRPVEIEVLPHQHEFMLDEHRFVALTGGFGCGKSYAAALKLFFLAQKNQGFDGMLISRTGSQMERLLIEVIKVFKSLGLTMFDGDFKQFSASAPSYSFLRYGSGRVYIKWAPGLFSTIWLGTTENKAYEKWAGGNMAFGVIDEIDTMPAPDLVWSFCNDRIRVGNFNQTACSSTPEGFGFLWNFFVNEKNKDPTLDDRHIIHGCTLDSPYLNKDYVLSQIKTRDPKSMRAYIYGEFVNLDGHLVYWAFDKNKHITNRTIDDFPMNAVAHVSIDWNKNLNATNIWFVENGKQYAVHEIMGSVDSRELCNRLRKVIAGRPAMFYPDGSGFEAIQTLKYNFGEDNIFYHEANPKIRKTVAAVLRRMIDDELFVNPDTCPTLYTGFLRQVKNAEGEPDKKQGLDHNLDGSRYFTYWNWPVDEGFSEVTLAHTEPDFGRSFSMNSSLRGFQQ